jgi:transposase
MISKRKPYNIYTKEFKLEAIRLMNESDRPASQIAMELGIRRNQLYKWKEQMNKTGDVASPKKGRPRKEDQSEVSRLKQELKRLKEENEILKKAAVFFAKELG